AGQISVNQLDSLLCLHIPVGSGLAQQQDRQGWYALAQVGARGLARVSFLGGQVNYVIGNLEGHANLFAVFAQHVDEFRGAAETSAEGARGRKERSGLVTDHLDVVLNDVIAFARADGFMQLSKAQSFEGARLPHDRFRAQLGAEDRSTGEDQVAGQDGYGVAPDFVGGRCTT